MPICPRQRVPLSLTIAASLLLVQTALAEAPIPCPEPRALPKRVATTEELPTHVRANEANTAQEGLSEFTGNVEMTRGQNRLRADRVTYDNQTDLADATGNVTLDNAGGDSYRTQELHMHVESHRGHAGPGSFTLQSNDGRGEMQRVEFQDQDHTHLKQVRYTTCPVGQDDWYVHAPEIEIDNVEEMAYVRNAWIEFKGVPIYYIPRGGFSISDKRKSGFLTPSFGYASQNGIDVAAPYYFNLAPNYDATITPHVMSLRGLQLQNQFRYLTQRSQGQVEIDVLPDDQKRDRDRLTDQPLNKDRYAGKYVHAHTFSSLWSANVDVRGVSDKDYLRDFSTNLNTTSTTHLPQNAEANYRGPLWNFTARLNDHQTVDKTIAPADRPYARLPQLLLFANTPTVSGQTQYHFSSELVRFDRDASVTGDRLNLIPAVSYPMLRSYGFVTPKVGVRYIGYNLSNTPDIAPSVARPFLSLDSGLFFERDIVWSGHDLVQTLEPRIYYLHVPRKNQDHLPNFDSGAPELNFPNLFRDQRLDGGDRIGDANQVTLAVTSRILDAEDGVERMRGSIGRIYYLDDREVNLPAGTTGSKSSDVVAEAAARLRSHWFVNTAVQLDTAEHRTQRSNLYLQYNPARNKIINFGQRYTRLDLHQRDVSFEWPLIRQWSIRARALDSLRDNRILESYVGAQYTTCCWAFRALLGRRLVESDPATNRFKYGKFIMFELELTGLTAYKRGDLSESPLKQSMFNSFPEDRWTTRGP
ncbi:MAG TPA: LPS-assembly protein LptD [Burkholderiales bacterium]|nr:LPS-assembly protein LptD [Burkholderiales bacterium]